MIKILHHFREKSMAVYAEAKTSLHKMPLDILSDWLFLTWDFPVSIIFPPSQTAIEMFRLLLGILVEV